MFRTFVLLATAGIVLAFTLPQRHILYMPFVYRTARTSDVVCHGQIVCLVFEDMNGNRLRDANEIGMSNVRLTLRRFNSRREVVVRTNQKGESAIVVRPGLYVLRADTPDNHQWTTPHVWGIDIVCSTIRVNFGLAPISESGEPTTQDMLIPNGLTALPSTITKNDANDAAIH